MMNSDLKKFIESYIDWIELGKFNVVYTDARYNIECVGELTDTLLKINVNPLDHIEYIPAFYLDGSVQPEFIVPENIIRGEQHCFAYSSVSNIILHDKFELPNSCFSRSYIKSVKIPYIMNEVPDECFYGCAGLTDVDLNAVDQLGSECFALCPNLKEILIPDTITYIADSAFQHTDVTFLIQEDNEYAEEWARKHKKEFRYIK